MRINTVCLCGSTKFLDAFAQATVELTRRGFSVISISMALPKEQGELKPEDKPLKEWLDLVHFNKILRSDAIVVVGNGYIGFSTAREIIWADMQGKPVLSMANYAVHYSPEAMYDALALNLRNGEGANATMLAEAQRVLNHLYNK